MKTVWVVQDNAYDGNIVTIFSNEESAKTFCETSKPFNDYFYSEWIVDEFTLRFSHPRNS